MINRLFKHIKFNENIFLIIAIRYKKLYNTSNKTGGSYDVTFEIYSYLVDP